MAEVLELRPRRAEAAGGDVTSVEPSRCTAPLLMPPVSSAKAPTTVFDRYWRQYALCREHLFTDHTRQIASALSPILNGPSPRYLVEAGCGPGFYSRRLAAQFPQLHITGIDLSEPLLLRAEARARRSGLRNCRFLKADALSLADFPGQVDAVIASRLFLILVQPALALDAIFTSLRPGGLCFIAEPASALRASIPLMLMRMTGSLGRASSPIGPLPQSRVLSGRDFEYLIESRPWKNIRIWKDRQYHCAVCEKAA